MCLGESRVKTNVPNYRTQWHTLVGRKMKGVEVISFFRGTRALDSPAFRPLWFRVSQEEVAMEVEEEPLPEQPAAEPLLQMCNRAVSEGSGGSGGTIGS